MLEASIHDDPDDECRVMAAHAATMISKVYTTHVPPPKSDGFDGNLRYSSNFLDF